VIYAMRISDIGGAMVASPGGQSPHTCKIQSLVTEVKNTVYVIITP